MGKLNQHIESFEDLEVWKESRKLRKRVSKFVNTLPKDEEYLTEKGYDSLKEQTITCIKLVNGYIGYLKRSKANFVKESEIQYLVDSNNK